MKLPWTALGKSGLALVALVGVALLVLLGYTGGQLEDLLAVDQFIDRAAIPLLFMRLVLYGVGIRYLPVWRRIVPAQRRDSRLLIAAVCVIYEIVIVQRSFF